MASICLNLIVIGLTIGVFVVLFLMSLGTIRAWERL